MTGRTHDLAAFTALSAVIAIAQPTGLITLSTLLLALLANQIGGVVPDIDQPTAPFWRNLPIGNFFGKIFGRLSGGHRFITHSFIGLALFGFAARAALTAVSPLLGQTDTGLVWWAFMIGMASHLLMDTFTKEGVPYLLPIPIKFGFPPVRWLRITTGKRVEQLIVFPGLLIVCALIYINSYELFIRLLHSL